MGLQDRVDEEELRMAWGELVGEFLSSHSSPESLRNGVLTIQVLQPSVRYELERSWRSDVLQRLQQRFGAKKIRNVVFR